MMRTFFFLLILAMQWKRKFMQIDAKKICSSVAKGKKVPITRQEASFQKLILTCRISSNLLLCVNTNNINKHRLFFSLQFFLLFASILMESRGNGIEKDINLPLNFDTLIIILYFFLVHSFSDSICCQISCQYQTTINTSSRICFCKIERKHQTPLTPCRFNIL